MDIYKCEKSYYFNIHNIYLFEMASSSCSLPTPPVFSGENYQIWAIKKKTYLSAFDIWDVVEQEKELPHLLVNPIVNQMKNYSEEKVKRFKAKS